MIHDDPKLTAYALNELDANDCAEVERAILEQPHTNAEIAETREMAGILRDTLKAESALVLREHQRDAIFRAAGIAGKAAKPALENVVDPVQLAWWQRAGFWQLATACMVFGFGVYAIGVSLGKSGQNGTGVAQTSDAQKVQIGNLAASDGVQTEINPTLKVPPLSPQEGTPSIAANFNTTQTAHAVVASVPNDLTNKLQPVAPKHPQVVGSDDPLAAFKASADIGKKAPVKTESQSPSLSVTSSHEQVLLPSDNGDVKLTREEALRYFSVREYLDSRWREASSLHEGSSYAELSRIFRHESYADGVHRFVMIRCPSIKVGVSFVSNEKTEAEWPLAPDAKIRSISKPYFEPEQGN